MEEQGTAKSEEVNTSIITIPRSVFFAFSYFKMRILYTMTSTNGLDSKILSSIYMSNQIDL